MSSAVHAGVVRGRRRGRTRLLIGLVAGALIVAGLAYLIAFSPVFAVRETVIEGTKRLPADEISRAAAVRSGEALVWVSEAGIGRRVAALPGVRRVTVSRELPGTVRIVVTERVPVLAVDSADGRSVVDAEGVEFPARAGDKLLRAEVAGQDPELLGDAARVAGVLPEELRKPARVLTVPSRDGITLELDRGRTVFFGSADDAGTKASVAVVLLGQDAAKQGGVVDVSSPGNPVIR